MKSIESIVDTAHHLTSRAASAASIAGCFAPGKNILRTSQRTALSDGCASRWVLPDRISTPPDAISITERFDLVIGSGRKGQTYLTGKRRSTLSTAGSYWTEVGSWVNSPGYGDRTLEFSRPVVPRCLECHGSFFEPVSEGGSKSLSQTGLRARRFVRTLSWSRQQARGAKRTGKPKPAEQAIVNPAKLTRNAGLRCVRYVMADRRRNRLCSLSRLVMHWKTFSSWRRRGE